MTSLKKSTSVIVLLTLLFPTCLGGQSLRNRIDSLWTVYSGKGLSGVLLVADQGRPVFYKASGYRTFADSVPLRRDDIFELASVSKQFTAMIIMRLQEKGLLQYDDLLDKYITLPYPGITLRHLLNHTSGLPDYQAIMDQHWDKSKVAGNEECIAYLRQYAPPALFSPGSRYQYSNTGYLLLASVAEKITGKNFIQLCRTWIFRPLKMKNTDIRSGAEKAALARFALGHIYVKDRDRYIRADSFPSSDYTIWLGNRRGPGRISSTAADLLKWDRALYQAKLVSRGTQEKAFAAASLTGGNLSDYGFGWDLRQDSVLGRIVEHNGDNPGYKTMITRYLDRKQTVILLCNNAHRGVEPLLKELERALAAEPKN